MPFCNQKSIYLVNLIQFFIHFDFKYIAPVLLVLMCANTHKVALAIRHIFSLVDMITIAKFSNSHNYLKICLFG